VAASRTACLGSSACGRNDCRRTVGGAVELQSNGSRTAVRRQSHRSCNQRLTDKSDERGLLAGLKGDAQLISVADDGRMRCSVRDVLLAVECQLIVRPLYTHTHTHTV